MEGFPGNSNKDKVVQPKQAAKAEKKVEKVVTGEVIKKKKSFSERFRGVFFGGDARSASRYIFADVLIPALKNMVVDATAKGMDRLIYGDSLRSRRPGPQGPRMQYNSPVQRYRQPPSGPMLPDQPPLRNHSRNASDVILVSREEADLVLEQLYEIVNSYQVATLADLNTLVGLPSSFIDNKWGWFNLQYAQIRQTRDGYVLELPPVEPID